MGCSTGGCGTEKNGVPAGCNNNGSCGTSDGCNKLTVFDWLGNMNLPEGQSQFDIVEVRFKNSRKEFFRNLNNLSLSVGEVIAPVISSFNYSSNITRCVTITFTRNLVFSSLCS